MKLYTSINRKYASQFHFILIIFYTEAPKYMKFGKTPLVQPGQWYEVGGVRQIDQGTCIMFLLVNNGDIFNVIFLLFSLFCGETDLELDGFEIIIINL